MPASAPERAGEAILGGLDGRDVLESALEAAPDAVLVFDREGRYLYVSPSAARSLGRDAEAIIGRTWRDLELAPEVMEPFEADREQVQRTGQPLTRETAFASPEGVRRMEYSLSPIRSPGGEIEATVAIVRDITERALVEEERERLVRQLELQSERATRLAVDAQCHAGELDAVFAAMADPINLYREDGVLWRANPASVEVFGFDPTGMHRDELRQRLNIRHPDGRPMSLEDLPSTRGLRGEHVKRERLLFTNGAGEERVALITMSPILKDSAVIGAVGVWHDVTDLERAVAGLETERARLTAVMQQMPAGLVLVEAPSGRVVIRNEQARQILEQPLTVVTTDERFANDPSLRGLHPDGTPYQPYEYPLMRSLRDGEIVTGEEVEVVLLDGSRRTLSINSGPIRNREGKIVAGVATIFDITERLRAQRALKESEERYRRLVERSPEMIAVAVAGRYVFINAAGVRLLGAQRATEIMGHPVLDTVHPDFRPRVAERLKRVEEEREEAPLTVGRVVRLDGQVIDVEALAVPILFEGKPAAQIIVRDISDRVQAQRERDMARQRLLDSEREKKRFYREIIRAITNGRFCLVEPSQVPTHGQPALALSLDGEGSYRTLRQRIRELAQQAGMSEEDTRDLVLAAGEAATNAIKHGKDSYCKVFLAPERIAVRVGDHGPGIQPENLPAQLLLPGFSTKVSLGMGYTIMLQLADRIWLATGPQGTILQVEKWIHPEQHQVPELPVAWERL